MVTSWREGSRMKHKLGLLGLFTGGVVIVISALTGNAEAGYLDTQFKNPGMNNSALTVLHIEGAFEGADAIDAPFIQPPLPSVDIYSNSYTKLGLEARPVGSMSTINAEITGVGLTDPNTFEIEAVMYEDFPGKKIIADVSQRGDDGMGGYKYNKIGTYDLKNMSESGQTIKLTVSNGITKDSIFYPSHKMNYKFYNTNVADLNNDGKVDFQDFAIFRKRLEKRYWKLSC